MLHLGNLRTALLAWLFARSEGSAFVLRFEDLDRQAVRPRYYDAARRDLERLGLDWDDELAQHEHLERYRGALADLEERGLTYPCFCSRREIREAAAAPHGDVGGDAYPGTCRGLGAAERAARIAAGEPHAHRVFGDGLDRTFVDRIAGTYTGAVDDFVLTRRDGMPAYNFAVVVDDHHQDIEEVVRGDDLLSSTPRQLYLAELLGIAAPAFAHVPLVLGPGGDRLAKRDGAVTLDDRLAAGQTPAEVRGWLASSLGLAEAGTAPTVEAIVERFDPARLPRAPWRLRPEDLGVGPTR